jgi:hypothetical protein
LRTKAAAAALAHETPRLTPVPPALELTAEPVVPLAELVEQQRARIYRMMALSLEERSALITGVGCNGNGDGDDHS